MKRRSVLRFLFLGGLLWAWTTFAQVSTVLLATGGSDKFSIAPDKSQTLNFTFAEGAKLFSDSSITACHLRIVARSNDECNPKCKIGGEACNRDDQDVGVVVNNNQIGEWSAYGQASQVYDVELNPPTSCAGELTLKSLSSIKTEWCYYGPKATEDTKKPRLIITYTAAANQNTARPGRSTNWTYAAPWTSVGPISSFFASSLGLPKGVQRCTNPVSWEGQVFVVVGLPASTSLYRLNGPVQFWNLDQKTDANSAAFVTQSGVLKVITTDRLYSCDLTKLPAPSANLNCFSDTPNIQINAGETPAMATDGSLYFKNVREDGRIVGFDPSRQEIWQTDTLFTKISPITLNGDGHYAYLIAEISPQGQKERDLVRIDTWTGEKAITKIEDDKQINPLLKDMFQPAVVSKLLGEAKQGVDYVFIGASTEDIKAPGIVQAYRSDSGVSTLKRLWTLPDRGEVQAAPVVSSGDGKYLFVAQNGKVSRYEWFEDKAGDPTKPAPVSVGNGITLLFDGSSTIYRPPSEYKAPQFMSDGTIIGYQGDQIFDISPRSDDYLKVRELSPGTIYSSGKIYVLPRAVKQPCKKIAGVTNDSKCKDAVILKGKSVQLPRDFRWPLGATLQIESVQ